LETPVQLIENTLKYLLEAIGLRFSAVSKMSGCITTKNLAALCSELAGSETLRLNEIETMKKKRLWKTKTAAETDGCTSG
jgi:hypothetical protein